MPVVPGGDPVAVSSRVGREGCTVPTNEMRGRSDEGGLYFDTPIPRFFRNQSGRSGCVWMCWREGEEGGKRNE